jgi:hypothetical protein
MRGPRPTRYEKTQSDLREDRRGAKRLGVSLSQYEKTQRDKREDAAGQRRLDKRK